MNSTQQPPILTVSQLTQAVKMCLEGTFPMVWLQGEVSNFKEQSSGHLYFSLKDAQAQISAVMFRGDAVSLRLMPKVGDHVIVRGELNVYPPKGNYQIIVRELSQVGLGELLLRLEQLKLKLHQMGWFSKERKKPLPKMPRRIGIVTSPTGAAIQDILNILGRRFAGVPILLNPVKVQGEGAAREIAQAIEQFNRYQLVDVMIVGRGGGSIEDLWAFNEEVVAAAIYNSQIPIISAVGHETDHCIADYVADVRAPTPSAAAELVIAERTHYVQHLSQVERRLVQTMTHLVRQRRHKLEGLSRQPVLMSPYALVGAWMQKIDDLRFDVDMAIRQYLQRKRLELEAKEKAVQQSKPSTQIQHLRQRFTALEKTLGQTLSQKVSRYREHLKGFEEHLSAAWRNREIHSRQRLEALKTTLSAIDPKNLLKKGYSIVFAEKGDLVINSVQAIKEHRKIRILLSDGQVAATVDKE